MIIPTIIEQDSNKEVIYDLYSRLLKDRIIFISGEIDDHLSSIVVSELLYLNSINHDDISIYINSPGGSVSAGLAIYDTMNYIESDISTIGIGIAASMGAFLLSSGTKGKRYALKNTDIMIHEPLGGMSGKATEIQIENDRIQYLKNKLNKILAKNTGKTIKQIEKDTSKDNYMDSKCALTYGLIDKIL